MLIVETPIFTKKIVSILSDEEYRLLQLHLLDEPDAGKVIQGSGGLRKLRWSAKGHEREAVYGLYTINLLLMRPFCFFSRTRRTNGTI